MENKIYEKPAMKFVELRNEQAVANTCWGGTIEKQNLTWYYDTEGVGFISFQMKGKSCEGAQPINVYYYGEDTDGDGKITKNDNCINASEAQKGELLEKLGGKANNWDGESSLTPTEPHPSWS